jgi:predicted DNA-binding protein with PD1-like motif
MGHPQAHRLRLPASQKLAPTNEEFMNISLHLAPSPRFLVHPGKPLDKRIQSLQASAAQHFRLKLYPNTSLHQGLVDQLSDHGIQDASITILGGLFSSLQYCVAPPDPYKEAVIRYSSPIKVGASEFIFGNATIGKNLEGKSIVHCHAAFVDSTGIPRGGHIIASDSYIGDEPIYALVTSLDEFELRVGLDTETNIPLLRPVSKSLEMIHE